MSCFNQRFAYVTPFSLLPAKPVFVVEYLTSLHEIYPVRREFAGYPAAMTLADRVHSDHDIAPLEASKSYPDSIEKVLHFSGKARDIQDFEFF